MRPGASLDPSSSMRGAATAALAKLASTGRLEDTGVPSVLTVALLILLAKSLLLVWQNS